MPARKARGEPDDFRAGARAHAENARIGWQITKSRLHQQMQRVTQGRHPGILLVVHGGLVGAKVGLHGFDVHRGEKPYNVWHC